MGLSNFPTPGEGVLPLLAMSVVVVKSKFRSVLEMVGGEYSGGGGGGERMVSITRYASICGDRGGVECCVCLCGFEGDEEVSELSCKHFFHKACLDKWFDNHHITCPLCRSII